MLPIRLVQIQIYLLLKEESLSQELKKNLDYVVVSRGLQKVYLKVMEVKSAKIAKHKESFNSTNE